MMSCLVVSIFYLLMNVKMKTMSGASEALTKCYGQLYMYKQSLVYHGQYNNRMKLAT